MDIENLEARASGGWRPKPPTGKTSQRWYAEGYQAALRDIQEKLAQGGESAAKEWVDNNLAS